jgi:hypothetical protein
MELRNFTLQLDHLVNTKIPMISKIIVPIILISGVAFLIGALSIYDY